MGETQAKYHHLIPQTYMSAWANDAGTLNVEFLNNPEVFEPKNKDNIAGITDYHSIKAGMVICTKDDADKVFAPLRNYTVEIDGQVITDTLELNQKYLDDGGVIYTHAIESLKHTNFHFLIADGPTYCR